MRKIIEQRTGLKLQEITPKQIKKNGGHVVGKKYYCSYWQLVYEVLEISINSYGYWSVVCKWQDGHTNSHSTSLTPGRDFEVIPA